MYHSSCVNPTHSEAPARAQNSNLSFHAFYNSGYGIMNYLVKAKRVGMNEVAQAVEMQESKI